MLTIVRHDLGRPLEQIVGQDIARQDADALLDAGAAEPGPDYELPPALYLTIELEIHGTVYAPGAMLHVGGEITEGEALLLLRGSIARPHETVVSVPGGGIG